MPRCRLVSPIGVRCVRGAHCALQRIARAQARRVAALRAAEQEIAALERRRAERVEQRCATLLEAHERCQEAQGMLMGAFQCGETRAALDACRKRARYGDDENGALPAKPSTEDGNQSALFMPPAWVMDAFETYVTTPARQAAEAQERAMEGFLRGVDSSSKPEK